MKELTIEEKAKAYDYAVNKAKELILNENGVVRVDKPLFDELFPSEMEESEDEKIRKGLIEYFKDFRLGTFAYLEPKKILAWLEKQGEHSVSPLFTFEDVLTIQCAMAYAKFQDRELDVALKKLHDKVYDAYYDSKNHHIESQDGLKGEQKPADKVETKDYRSVDPHFFKPADKVEPKFKVGDTIKRKGDIVIVSEVDLKNKEYRLTNTGFIPFKYENLWELVEQKPAEWDNNDEYIFNTILHTLDLKKCKFEKEGNSEEAERWHTYYNWMKPLKNRILPQPKQEWSEEDEKFLSDIIKDLVHPWNEYIPDRIEDEIKWLKNRLKFLSPQSQNIMSEDEFAHIVGYLVQDIVANEHMPEGEKQPTRVFVEKYHNKLRPQNTLKPSDEQLKSLKEVIDVGHFTSYPNALETLYEQLKKLREE